MSDDLEATGAGDGSPRLDWREALDSLEQSLREASQAAALLRRALEGQSTVPTPTAAPAPATTAPAPAAAAPAPAATPAPVQPAPEGEPTLIPPAQLVPAPKDAPGLSAFDRLWDRIEREKMEKAEPVAEEQSDHQPLEGVPQLYLMTVEDREGKVDLVPLHRSLSGLRGMGEVSLVSYANGVPVISLRTQRELDLEELGRVVAGAMDRECEVIPQDRGRLYLRLKAS